MYKLLIVEDENLERTALKILIQRHFDSIDIVGEAKNGLEAVTLAKKYSPHIILMDIEMPQMNGLMAQKEIIKFLPEVKTIILTAYDIFDFAQTAIKLYVFDYILKPVQPNGLMKAIEKAIDKISTSSVNLQSTSLQDNNSTDILINDALKYIKTHYNENINLDTVASYVHLNSQYFSRYFKHKLGMNFIDYLSYIKIENAKDLLANTDKSITEISLKVGYIDSSYFSKVFMKHVGMTPLKFRMINRKSFHQL